MSDDGRGCRLGCIALVLVAIAGFFLYRSFGPLPESMTVDEALKRNVLAIETRSQDPNTMTFDLTLNSTDETTIVFPAGTTYQSADRDLQTFVAARSAEVRFHGIATPQRSGESQEVYCTNRFLKVPQEHQPYGITTGAGEGELQRLAECISQKHPDANADERRMAVWIVGHHLLDKTQEEALGMFRDGLREEAHAKANALLEKAAEEMRSRGLPPETVERVLQRYRETKLSDAVDSTISDELRSNWPAAQPLLSDCGYDVAMKPFLRTAMAATHD